MENLKTLLVDDEVEFVQSLAERLRIRNLSADTAFNGQQALSFVQKQAPDVMVLDLKMPGMNGLEVLRQIQKNYPEIQVIMLTGHGTRTHEDEARRLGAFGFLEKPVNIDTLVKEIWAAYKKKVEKTMAAAAFAEYAEFETARDLLKEEEPRESGQMAKMTRDQSHQDERQHGGGGPLQCCNEQETNSQRAFFLKGQLERRQHARFRVPSLSARVVFRRHWPRSPIVGEVVNMSAGGLSFRYTASEKQSHRSSRLDILLNDLLSDGNLQLHKIPIKTIYDFEVHSETSSGFETRQCGVQFEDLTNNQESDLMNFIRGHTAADPEA